MVAIVCSCWYIQWHLNNGTYANPNFIRTLQKNGSQINGNERLEKLHVYLFN